MVRFRRAAVVLDSQTRSVFELLDDAAQAFDVLTDRDAVWPESSRAAERVRRVLRGLRREILGETVLGPHESVGLDDSNGAVLLRRYSEPKQWRRAGPSNSAEVSGTLVRLPHGVLLILGPLAATSRVGQAFEHVHADVIRRDIVSIQPERMFRSSAWRETLQALGAWSVDLTSPGGLTLHRLSPERALIKLLSQTMGRPDDAALKVLASCAEGVPNFAVLAPPEPLSIATALKGYHGLHLP